MNKVTVSILKVETINFYKILYHWQRETNIAGNMYFAGAELFIV